jgi:hypothetical protein
MRNLQQAQAWGYQVGPLLVCIALGCRTANPGYDTLAYREPPPVAVKSWYCDQAQVADQRRWWLEAAEAGTVPELRTACDLLAWLGQPEQLELTVGGSIPKAVFLYADLRDSGPRLELTDQGGAWVLSAPVRIAQPRR